MAEHQVVGRTEWQTARDALLAREKELTRRSDELARERRELPWVAVEKEYRFDTEDGSKTLAELFDGRSQLMTYNFMFGPTYEAGCPVCSSGADTFDGTVAHLAARDVTFTCISRAPLDRLLDYRRRMGWSFPWVSSEPSDFNRDFGALNTEEDLAPFLATEVGPVVTEFSRSCGTDPAGYLAEAPVLNVFALGDGVVHQTYSAGRRGLEVLLGFYGLLDRVPKGRDETAGAPRWLRRHDEY